MYCCFIVLFWFWRCLDLFWLWCCLSMFVIVNTLGLFGVYCYLLLRLVYWCWFSWLISSLCCMYKFVGFAFVCCFLVTMLFDCLLLLGIWWKCCFSWCFGLLVYCLFACLCCGVWVSFCFQFELYYVCCWGMLYVCGCCVRY